MPAHMIPPVPKEYDETSDEGFVFDVLKNKLSEDFYVFHSVSPTVVKDGVIYEREIDFVIAHKDLGIMCLEAKNGANIYYDSYYREWKYGNGCTMDHGGPYMQISTAKRTLHNKIENHANFDVRRLLSRTKVCHAVFFFKMADSRFRLLEQNGLPENCDRRITLLADDIPNLEDAIKRIFAIKLSSDQYTNVDHCLSEREFRLLLDSVLCPEFKLIPSPEAKGIASEYQMNQLLHEQYRILDFISEVDVAVINGAAGTGKTMLAAEKARQHSINGERVLFLCYNRLLCDDLIQRWKKNPNGAVKNQYANVDFMTISKLAKEKTGSFSDYNGLLEWLYDCAGNAEAFGYRHVIVDEGQDFGLIDSELHVTDKDAAESCSIIDALQEVAQSCGGTFFLFYDKYQMIQGRSDADYRIPSCIQNCDCRLTLTRNCRNTMEIAKTSVTPLRNEKSKAIKPTVASAWFEPEVPVMHLVQNETSAMEALNQILDTYIAAGIDDVVILTPESIECSFIANYIASGNGQDTMYQYQRKVYRVSTCRKFKGLEATAIIMLDLNRDSFTGKKGLNFYVGASRAKRRLDLICQLTEKDYYPVVHELDANAPKKDDAKRMKAILGRTFSAEIVTV